MPSRYAGNPLVVVLDADGPPDGAMQQIAAEANYSEMTFVSTAREQGDGFRVRILTPAREIAFAGHPILGTAWVAMARVTCARGVTWSRSCRESCCDIR